MSPLRDPRAGQDQASAPQKIALVGLRASGKTTVGELLARELGREFVDLDREIARAEQASSAGELLARIGEPAFRALESRALSEVLVRPGPFVLASGGGTVIDAQNRARLRALAWVVWLEAPVAELARRISADPTPRPSLTGAGTIEELATLAEARRAWYEEVAHLRVRTEGLPPELVARLVRSGASGAGG